MIRIRARLLAAILLATAIGILPAAAVPPLNDACPVALTIPDGPYPLAMPSVESADATPQGADDGGLFPVACNPFGTDRTV